DKTIRIWNARTGQLVTDPLQEHTDSVTSVAYSLDGQQIVSGHSCESQLTLSDWCSKDNGWISTPSGSVICWLPPWVGCISDPRNTMVILPQCSLKPDFTDFAYGKLWTHCWA
ncbi:hypothetical protein HYDPIDRAFT_94379, partial [Hydnomerulius pinastri MD-312]